MTDTDVSFGYLAIREDNMICNERNLKKLYLKEKLKMLSSNQIENIKRVGEILVNMAASEDIVDRAILSAKGNLYLKEILNEDLEICLRNMIDIPDFMKR